MSYNFWGQIPLLYVLIISDNTCHLCNLTCNPLFWSVPFIPSILYAPRRKCSILAKIVFLRPSMVLCKKQLSNTYLLEKKIGGNYVYLFSLRFFLFPHLDEWMISQSLYELLSQSEERWQLFIDWKDLKLCHLENEGSGKFKTEKMRCDSCLQMFKVLLRR